MSGTEWEIRGREFGNCNCDYGCPCQFNALPTHGNCNGVVATEVDEGRHGDVSLDGLRFAVIYRWPGAVHEGNGEMQVIIDEWADDAQRHALQRILNGQDTDDMATYWWVYAAMAPTKHETLFMPIDFEIDIDGRTGRIDIPGIVEATGQPIRNRSTGAEVRARIDLPNGFEYRLAEMGSASATTTGAIALDLNDSYGQFNVVHLSHAGYVD